MFVPLVVNFRFDEEPGATLGHQKQRTSLNQFSKGWKGLKNAKTSSEDPRIVAIIKLGRYLFGSSSRLRGIERKCQREVDHGRLMFDNV